MEKGGMTLLTVQINNNGIKKILMKKRKEMNIKTNISIIAPFYYFLL